MFLASVLLLEACGGGVKLASPSPIAGFTAADEPHAVTVARDILAQGGNAVDAAVALGFTLAVTLPSRASLGGGGACLVRIGRGLEQGNLIAALNTSEVEKTPTQSIDFMPRAARNGAGIGVPSVPRGLFSMQAKYGNLRWAQLVAPAENMARFGVPVSRALIRDIAAAHADITGPTGEPVAEGDLLPQSDLATTMAILRTQGAGVLAAGALADAIVAGSAGDIDAAGLRAMTPIWGSPQGVPFGNDMIYFSPAPGGVLAEKLWRSVRKTPDGSAYATLLRVIDAAPEAGDPVQRAFAVADAGGAMLALPAGRTAPGDGDAATSFVVVDGRGDAVACTLTTGRLFGAGRFIGTTGILASLPVPGEASDGLSGAAMLVVNENTRKLLAAVAVGGDHSGPEVMVQVALNTFAGGKSAGEALQVARLYAPSPGTLFAEPGLPLGQRQATEVAALGSVNAVVCPSGLPVEKPDCLAQSDPRRAGFTGSLAGPGGNAPRAPGPPPNEKQPKF
jgi:gamma-glutamyltranspeptidase/glutathione hydrolase